MSSLHHHRAVVAEAKEHLGDIAGNLRGGLARYLDLGMQPGDFLCAALDNDLAAAVSRASDPETLRPLVLYLLHHVPAPAWGSKEKRLAWQERVSTLVAEVEPEREEVADTEPPAATGVEVIGAP